MWKHTRDSQRWGGGEALALREHLARKGGTAKGQTTGTHGAPACPGVHKTGLAYTREAAEVPGAQRHINGRHGTRSWNKILGRPHTRPAPLRPPACDTAHTCERRNEQRARAHRADGEAEKGAARFAALLRCQPVPHAVVARHRLLVIVRKHAALEVAACGEQRGGTGLDRRENAVLTWVSPVPLVKGPSARTTR